MRDLLLGLMSDEKGVPAETLKGAISAAVLSGIGEALGIAFPFGIVITELIDEATYDPEDANFIDIVVHVAKEIFSERPNELVTLATNIGSIFENHEPDVTAAHMQAQDYFYTDLYNDIKGQSYFETDLSNDTQTAELSPVGLRDNADMGRVSFYGFNDLKLGSGGTEYVVVDGKYVGKSTVSKCDGGFAAGYYSFATVEKMELFLPVNREFRLLSDSYSKKPYHDVSYDIYCQYNSIGSAGTLKRYIGRYRGEFSYVSDPVAQTFTVNP